jgi:outer membrane protein
MTKLWPAFFMGALFLCLLSPPAGAQQEVTLQQVLEVALKNNPGVAASQSEVEAAKALVTQAQAGYLPQVSGQAGYDRKWSDSSSSSSLSSSSSSYSRSGQYDYYSAQLSLSQYLYDFGKTSGKVEASRSNLSASQKSLATTLSDLIRDVKNAYYELLKKYHLVGVNEESLRVQQQHLDQAKAFHQAGIKPKIDVTKGEAELSQTRLELIQARYALRTAKVDLEKLLGGPPVVGPYKLAETPLRPPMPEGLKRLTKLALGKRPEIANLKAQLMAAQANLQTAQGGYWPTLNAEGAYGWADTDFPLDSAWQAGLMLQWDLFTGLRTKGQVDEARANILKLKAQIKDQELLVSQDVSKYYLNLHEASESIDTAAVGLKQAEENLALARGRYRTGVGNAIEFSDAEVLYTKAKSTLVQANYSYLQALAELERAVGGGPLK